MYNHVLRKRILLRSGVMQEMKVKKPSVSTKVSLHGSNAFWLSVGLALSTVLLFVQSSLTNVYLERIENKKAIIELQKLQYLDKMNFLATVNSELEASILRASIASGKSLVLDFVKEISAMKSLATRAELYFPEADFRHSIQIIFSCAVLMTRMGSQMIAMGQYSPEDRVVLNAFRSTTAGEQDKMIAIELIKLKKDIQDAARRMQSNLEKE